MTTRIVIMPIIILIFRDEEHVEGSSVGYVTATDILGDFVAVGIVM